MRTIYRFRTFVYSAVFYSTYVGKDSPDNVPYNFTGHSFRAQVRERRGKDGKVGKVVLNLPIIAAVPTNGQISCTLDRDITRALKNRGPDELEWDIVGIKADDTDYWIKRTEPIQIVTPATDPDDLSSGQVIPVQAITHHHTIAQIDGLQAILSDLLAAMSGVMEPAYVDGPITYPVPDGVYFIVADATGGNITLELPDPADRIGKSPLIIKRVDAAGGNTVLVDGTVDGSSGFTLPNQYTAIALRAVTGGYLLTAVYNV